MTGRLHEEVAIVTGGARGIGAAVARLLAAEGAAVTRVLIARIQHTGRNPVANRLAEAARLKSTMAGSIPAQQTRNGQPPAVTTLPPQQSNRPSR